MQSVPQGQEQQRRQLTNVTVSEKLQSLVNVMRHPMVRVDVEGLYVVVELGRVLEDGYLDVL